ncbi:hypothetical protein ASC66_06810 [Leifsonia sp. Root4]|nr:hypothetical protein ASC66_06810 [Leifsonia sp. Root4]
MHAGIPGQRMDEFIELLARRDALVDGLDGRSFCQWIGGLSRATAFAQYGLDAPTYRFLAEGREIAEDLVDRCLDLLNRWATSAATQLDVSAFPSVMQKDLLRALSELGEKRIALRSKPRTRKVELVPRLIFHPATGISVRLPSLEVITESRVDWIIAAEGATARRTVEAPWPGDPVRTEYFPVARPAKQIALTASPGDQTWILNILDPDDPLLVFDGSNGEWIPTRNTLPRSDIWIAVANPDNLRIEDLLEVEGAAPQQVIDGPMGWTGWLFAKISLSSVSKIRRRGAASWRYVSSVNRPTIEPTRESEWARALDGTPVSSELPRISLPASVDRDGKNASIDWTVTMIHADSGELIREVKTRSEPFDKVVDLDLPSRPLAGTFDFTVTGPLGRGASKRIALVRGLEIDVEVPFRHMSKLGDGLVPALITIENSLDSSASHRVNLASNESSRVVQIQNESDFRIVVATPAMAVAKVTRGGYVVTSHSPVAIDLEDLAVTQLQVTFGFPGQSQLVAMKGEQLLQTVTAVAIGPLGTATFNLSQLTETLAGSAGASLFVSANGDRIPVGWVRPRQLADAIELDAESPMQMNLVGLTTDLTLEAAFYPRYAPWSGPSVAKSNTGAVAVPLKLRGEGEARVVLRIDDPWVRFEWPREYPSRSVNIFDLDLGELADDRGGPDQGFRSWLTRRSDCPTDPSGLPLAISLYAGRDITKFRTSAELLRNDLARAIADNREFLPAAYPLSAVGAVPVDLFVAADVVTLPPAGYPHGADLWESSAFLAVLANSNSLSSVSDDVRRVLGESADRILMEGTDPFASRGRFGPNEEVIARWPEDRIETVWKSVNPVPGRTLDAGSRIIAAKQMFDQRWRISFDMREASHLLQVVETALQRTFGDEANAPMRARAGSSGWCSLPTLTISFALIARAAARNVSGASELHERTKPFLLGLARMSSKLVEQDLILAELWMTRWSAE